MANVLKHRFASGKADGGDASQIQPSHWNDGHAFTGGATGDILTRDLTDANFGATWTSGQWQFYTPNWSALLVAPALGDGNIFGRYRVIGKTVSYALRLATGAGTTYGSGIWMFTLPFPAFVDYQAVLVGTALAYTAGLTAYTGDAVSAVLYVTGANDRVTAVMNTGNQHAYAPFLQSTIPFTWSGAGNWLHLQGTYEMA